jgi:uncharacterized membrane protein YoaK (UPF0700 family)
MFVSHAHSFRQQARLAVTLAWIAGYTNILTVLTCGTVTSHVSGTTSNFGSGLARGDWSATSYLGFLLLCFCTGAMVAGFTMELGRRRGWESVFVLPIMIETFFLGAFAVFLEFNGPPVQQAGAALYWMTGLACAAMGLQNATITQISSGQVRTTHVTGVLTDIGQDLVQFLWWLHDRRRNIPPGPARGVVHGVLHHPAGRHLALLVSIFTFFALGAALGTFMYTFAARFAMFPPVAFLLWIVYQDIIIPIAEIEAADLLMANLDLPKALAVFHLRKDHDREGCVHRIPNLLAWAGRLPETTRVVILDLGEVTELNANAALELKALFKRFVTTGRELVIAGMTPLQVERMKLAGGDLLPLENVYSDLDLAIARGINCVMEPAPPERAGV